MGVAVGRSGVNCLVVETAEIEVWPDLPATILVAPVASVDARRALLRRLAAGSLGVAEDVVAIVHAEGRPPRLDRPVGAALHLSSASRGQLCALAASSRRVGIDLERIEDAEPPWRVLHSDEAAYLAGLEGPARGRAFARLWSLKEAYLKALGRGLSRDPASFAVSFANEGHATIFDLDRAVAAAARTSWRDAGGEVAVAVVTLQASSS